MYVSAISGLTLAEVLTTGGESTYAVGGSGSVPGPAAGALLSRLHYMSFDIGGNMYLGVPSMNKIFKIDSNQQISWLLAMEQLTVLGMVGLGQVLKFINHLMFMLIP
mmetsp:Transcript_37975/g.38662  ORF Transcript_37975/g.38662 Transcript_37975/m.38662 type:complete len:107 (+) Transcript_37975:377-697(+)